VCSDACHIPTDDVVVRSKPDEFGQVPTIAMPQPIEMALLRDEAMLDGAGNGHAPATAAAAAQCLQLEVVEHMREHSLQLRMISSSHQRVEAELQALRQSLAHLCKLSSPPGAAAVASGSLSQKSIEAVNQDGHAPGNGMSAVETAKSLAETASARSIIRGPSAGSCQGQGQGGRLPDIIRNTTPGMSEALTLPCDAAATGVFPVLHGQSNGKAQAAAEVAALSPKLVPTSARSAYSSEGSRAEVFQTKKRWTCRVCSEPNALSSPTCCFCDTPRPAPTRIQRFVNHWLFDLVCALAIICNAVSIGASSHRALVWALDNPGGKEVPSIFWEEVLGWFFMGFYTLELLLRSCAQGRKFIFGEDWGWNLFDIILVISVVYEKIMKLLFTAVVINVGWLRVLRLLKMMKIFRVVRLMRFFRILRLMVTQITGSLIMLFWASLLLFIMIFLFSLCFANGVTEYLLEKPTADISLFALEGIRLYWSSLSTAMTSLYMAMTGGVDWEDIADPLREASGLYYCIFLFYIGFSCISVVNVVTSLFVESALKISVQDETSVQTALLERREIEDLVQFFKHETSKPGTLGWQSFQRALKTQEMRDFQKCLGISLADVKRVFRLLQQNGIVELDEFVSGCIKMVDDSKALSIVQLHADNKRNADRLNELFNSFDHRFQLLLAASQNNGMTARGHELSPRRADLVQSKSALSFPESSSPRSEVPELPDFLQCV